MSSIIFLENDEVTFTSTVFFLWFTIITNYFVLIIMYSNYKSKKKVKFSHIIYNYFVNYKKIFKFLKENFFVLFLILVILVIVGLVINLSYFYLTDFKLSDPFFLHVHKCLFMSSIIIFISFYLFNLIFLRKKVKLEDALYSITLTKFLITLCIYTVLVYFGFAHSIILYTLPFLNEIWGFFLGNFFTTVRSMVHFNLLGMGLFNKIITNYPLTTIRTGHFISNSFNRKNIHINYDYPHMIYKSNFIYNLLFTRNVFSSLNIKFSCLSLSIKRNNFTTVNLKFHLSREISTDKIISVITKNKLSLTNFIWVNNPYKEAMILIKKGQVYIRLLATGDKYVFISSDRNFIERINNLTYTSKLNNFTSISLNHSPDKLLVNIDKKCIECDISNAHNLNSSNIKNLIKFSSFAKLNLKDLMYLPELTNINRDLYNPIVLPVGGGFGSGKGKGLMPNATDINELTASKKRARPESWNISSNSFFPNEWRGEADHATSPSNFNNQLSTEGELEVTQNSMFSNSGNFVYQDSNQLMPLNFSSDLAYLENQIPESSRESSFYQPNRELPVAGASNLIERPRGLITASLDPNLQNLDNPIYSLTHSEQLQSTQITNITSHSYFNEIFSNIDVNFNPLKEEFISWNWEAERYLRTREVMIITSLDSYIDNMVEGEKFDSMSNARDNNYIFFLLKSKADKFDLNLGNIKHLRFISIEPNHITALRKIHSEKLDFSNFIVEKKFSLYSEIFLEKRMLDASLLYSFAEDLNVSYRSIIPNKNTYSLIKDILFSRRQSGYHTVTTQDKLVLLSHLIELQESINKNS